jgi:hypothetical protein
MNRCLSKQRQNFHKLPMPTDAYVIRCVTLVRKIA